MTNQPLEFDNNGIVVFTPEIERQWKEVHRKIRSEYRAERRHAYALTGSILAAILVFGFLLF